jgi:hypothetical protein
MRILLALMLLVALLLSGCAFVQAPVVPPTGWAYTNIEAPLDPDFSSTDLGTKTGMSESCCVLGLFAWGDASAQAAAQDGGVQVIKHADYKFFNVLGVFMRFNTVVYGD